MAPGLNSEGFGRGASHGLSFRYCCEYTKRHYVGGGNVATRGISAYAGICRGI